MQDIITANYSLKSGLDHEFATFRPYDGLDFVVFRCLGRYLQVKLATLINGTSTLPLTVCFDCRHDTRCQWRRLIPYVL